MSKIAPLRAIVYNQDKIKDLASVVCPPYDVISKEKQEYYHDVNSCNLIHILLGKDISEEDKYQRAEKCFNDWLKNEILIREKNPAIYFYSQQYNIKGEKKTRLGFIALLRLEDKNTSVFGHEHTRLAAKEDRFKIITHVKANLSPIFVIFPDKKRIIQNIWKNHINQEKPFIEITDDEKTIHKLWRIDSPEILDKIQKIMENENIFIADGHHRYEVACNYREYMRQKLGFLTGDESVNYILSYFTNTDTRGLTIMPIHRLLKLKSKTNLDKFLSDISSYFDAEEVKDKIKFFFLMNKAGSNEHVLGMYYEKRFWLLRLKNVKILDKEILDKPKEYRSLDVSILNSIVFGKILGLAFDDKEVFTYSPDAEELIKKVDDNDKYVAFFLNPVKIEQVMVIALTGEKMPPKSTYFYPKVLSGLVINRLD